LPQVGIGRAAPASGHLRRAAFKMRVPLLVYAAAVLLWAASSQGTADELPVHVYNLPGTPECMKFATEECSMVVKMCASDESECEVQCQASAPPKVSAECLGTHPCATDVESLCPDVKPGAIMECLKSHQAELGPQCQRVRLRTAQRRPRSSLTAQSATLLVLPASLLRRATRAWRQIPSCAPTSTGWRAAWTRCPS